MMDAIGNMNSAAVVLDSPNIVCECGSKLFVEKAVLKKLSALYTGTGRDEIVTVPVWCCEKCGKIPTEMISSSDAERLFGETSKNESSLLIK